MTQDEANRKAREMLSDLHNVEFHSRYNSQAKRLAAVLVEHPNAALAQCSDERTGARFGRAKCRQGRCAKIGHTTFRYQLWAVW